MADAVERLLLVTEWARVRAEVRALPPLLLWLFLRDISMRLLPGATKEILKKLVFLNMRLLAGTEGEHENKQLFLSDISMRLLSRAKREHIRIQIFQLLPKLA